MPSYTFPSNFQWGVATAAYQIEGAANEDGRKDCVWDTFARRGGVRTGEGGAIACDHYHRYVDDVKLMAALGVKHYRLSVSWPRVMPDGTGAVNEAGIAFYERLIDCLLAHGITPHVTLFHWDTPQALEDRYLGWRDRQIADHFADYVTVVVKRLGDRVKDWFTLNEVGCFTYLSYGPDKPNAVSLSQKIPNCRVKIGLDANGPNFFGALWPLFNSHVQRWMTSVQFCSPFLCYSTGSGCLVRDRF